MEIPLFASGEENIYEAKIVDRPTDPRLRSVKVEAITIDSFFSTKSSRVAFVKCDVEGHEFHTLRGAQSMIQRSYPACLVEVTGNPDNSGSEASRTLEMLLSWGYTAYCIEGTHLVPFQQRHQSLGKSTDYLFVTQTHVNTLAEKGVLALVAEPKWRRRDGVVK